MKAEKSNWSSWRIIDIELADLGSSDVAEFSIRYRSSEPTILIYRLKELPWIGVAKCAPLNFMLWATELSGHLQHVDERRWVEPIHNEKSIYDAFRRDLKRAKISKKEVPYQLLGPYCQWGSYLGKSSLAFDGISIGMFRVAGTLAPSEYKDKLIDFYTKQLVQLGRFAFFPASEGEESKERPTSETLRKGYLDARLWRHPLRKDYRGEDERQQLLAHRCEEVKQVIRHLEADNDWDLSLHYHDAVRPGPTFLVERYDLSYKGVRVNVGPDEFPDTQMDVELYALRARLIRLLAWPNFYRSVDSLGIWQEIENLQKRGELLATQSSPYNFVEEILAFKREMEERYPVLLENPLKGLGE